MRNNQRVAVVAGVMLAATSYAAAGGRSASMGAWIPRSIDVGDLGEIAGTTGVEVRLPICSWEDLPDNYECVHRGYRSTVDDCEIEPATGFPRGRWILILPTDPDDTVMSWGPGLTLRHATAALCTYDHGYDPGESGSVQLTPGTGYETTSLVEIEALVSNGTTPGTVRGTISLELSWGTPRYGDITMALQQYDMDVGDYVDVDTRSILAPAGTYEIEHVVGPDADVRFQLRVKQYPDRDIGLAVYDVRLFGAHCFPDVFNPELCFE